MTQEKCKGIWIITSGGNRFLVEQPVDVGFRESHHLTGQSNGESDLNAPVPRPHRELRSHRAISIASA